MEQRKSYFAYDYLDHVDKLESRDFPAYEMFFSEIKQENTLAVEFDRYQKLIDGGLDTTAALLRMGLHDIPQTGVEKYDDLRIMFYRNNWRIADWLTYYNNLGMFLK